MCLSSVQLDPESRQDLACGGDQHLVLQGKLKMMRKAREPLLDCLLLFTEVRKCLPLADQ